MGRRQSWTRGRHSTRSQGRRPREPVGRKLARAEEADVGDAQHEASNTRRAAVAVAVCAGHSDWRPGRGWRDFNHRGMEAGNSEPWDA